jgi:TonB family protein
VLFDQFTRTVRRPLRYDIRDCHHVSHNEIDATGIQETKILIGCPHLLVRLSGTCLRRPDSVSKTATAFLQSTIGRSNRSGTRSLDCISWEGQSGKRSLRKMGMSAPPKLPVNAPDRFTQSTSKQPDTQLAETAKANPESVAVPIGVLEVPIGVWGSRRVESNSGQSERVEVFAEDTCTVIVFPQGAVIRLSARVAPGQLIMIANRKSGQIMLCRVVNVRTYPNIRGYAEIEFMHSATEFWGSYTPQGTLRLTATMASAVPSTSADFWSHGFPKEVVSLLANAVAASPAAPTVRAKKEPIKNHATLTPSAGKLVERVVTIRTNSESHSDWTSSQGSARFRALLLSWWRQRTIRARTDRTSVPRRRLVFVSVVSTLFSLSVLGVFVLHDGMEQSSGISQMSPMPKVSLGSPIPNVVQTSQPKSNISAVVPKLPIAKSENFPGTQTREFADNTRVSHPSERKATSERKIPRGRLLAPRSTANRSAALGRDMPADLIGVDSNTGAGALQGVLATLLPQGGRTKEPELLFSSAPIYPAMARQAHVEGQVTIDAVIDTTGKLTNMTIVSGAPLLRQAALDSLRTWKYQPGYLNEKPVPTKTSITVNFHLR